MKTLVKIMVMFLFLTTITINDAKSECNRTEAENEESWLKLSNKTICGCIYGDFFATPETNLKLVNEGKDPNRGWAQCNMLGTMMCPSSRIMIKYSNDTIKNEMSRYEGQPICIKGSTFQATYHPKIENPRFVEYFN